VGIAHHLGWAVAVTAAADHRVVDRRRIELIEPGMPPAPVHHLGGPHALHRPSAPIDDADLASLVTQVRASVRRATTTALEGLESEIPGPIVSISVVRWPRDFPGDIATQRRVPYESRADSVMYRQLLAEMARDRGWAVHSYDAKTVECHSAKILGTQANDVLHGPRAVLGPPWSKDHRSALAATVVAASTDTADIG
jgi:hypothetical protein